MQGSYETGGDGNHALPPACARVSALLPAFHAGTLHPTAMRDVLDHLTTCAGCADRFEAALAETYAILRDAPQPAALPGVRAAVFARIAAARAGRVRDGVAVPLPGATEDMMDDTDIDIETDTTPLRPPSASRRPARRLSRWLGSIAAILVVALLAAAVISHTRGAGQPTATATTTATTIAASPMPNSPCTPSASQVKLPARATIFEMALTSAREGWLVGAVFNTDDRTTQAGMIMRYANCSWQPVHDPLPNAFLDSISMVSPTEGWAVGFHQQSGKADQSYLLHLVNGHWQQVTVPYQPTNGAYYGEIRMLSAQEGWLVVSPDISDVGHVPTLLLHYHNGTWTQLVAPVPQMWDLAPIGPNDLWIVGNASTLNRQDSTIAHYQAGRWTTTPAPGHALLGSLRMLSPNDGYAIGWQPQPANSPQSAPPPAVVLHYDGKAWKAIQSGANSAAQTVVLFDHVDGWAFLQTSSPTIPANDVISSVQREVGGRWQRVAWPFTDVIQIGTIVAASADEYWAAAFYEVPPGGMDDFHWELLHYVNGAWHAYGHQ